MGDAANLHKACFQGRIAICLRSVSGILARPRCHDEGLDKIASETCRRDLGREGKMVFRISPHCAKGWMFEAICQDQITALLVDGW